MTERDPGVAEGSDRRWELRKAQTYCWVARSAAQALVGGSGAVFLSLLIFTPPMRREAHAAIFFAFSLLEVVYLYALFQCVNHWRTGDRIGFRSRYLIAFLAPLGTIYVATGEVLGRVPKHLWPIVYPQGEWWWGVVLTALVAIVGLAGVRFAQVFNDLIKLENDLLIPEAQLTWLEILDEHEHAILRNLEKAVVPEQETRNSNRYHSRKLQGRQPR